MALTEAAKEVSFLMALLEELGVPQPNGADILEDNQGCIALARNPVNHARTKHIDIRHHFIREAINKGKINLKYCPTKEMIADILTKPLARDQFEKLRSLMGVAREIMKLAEQGSN